MTHTNTFNTLHNYERLIKVGFNDVQAKEQTAIMSELIDNNLATKTDVFLIQRDIEASRLASKNDIALIQKDIAELRKDTKNNIALIESRITTKLVAITVIIPTILKLLEHFKI
jgi:hypothetical protein